MKQGLLIINLGTPDSLEVGAVRRYLREFLLDKRVIDLPWPIRYFLVYFLVLPRRPRISARAWQAIWTKEGSPLFVNSQHLAKKLQQRLADTHQVVLGMRYGRPSIEQALSQLVDCDKITILPLYPQYSSSATGSSIEKTLTLLSRQLTIPSVQVIRDFYQHPGFIAAQAALIQPHVQHHDYILFSYHGIPERHLEKAGCKPVCSGLCPPVSAKNQSCYRAQCQQTTAALAKELALSEGSYGTSFQSRLGKTPWISPYTDMELPRLIEKGVRRIAIACPSFVADCLETLEEIGIRANEQWQSLGGEQLTLIPCVNADDRWVEAIVDLVTRQP